MLQLVPLAGLIGVSLPFELKNKLVPLWVGLIGIVACIAWQVVLASADARIEALISASLGAVVSVLVVAPFVVWSGVGRDDYRLLIAAGASSGWPDVIACILFSSIAAAVVSVLVLLWRHNGRGAEVLRAITRRATEHSQKIPFSLAVALGTVWLMWWRSAPS